MIKSKIYLSEIVENKEFRFGQNKQYQPVTFVYPDGTEKEGLMTIPPFLQLSNVLGGTLKIFQKTKLLSISC